MARVLQGPMVEEAVQGALESEAVKKALLEAMDSELVDEVWRRLLATEQAQQLVERIAEAPEVRAAISAQGVGLIEDIGRTIGKAGPPPRRPLRADRAAALLPPSPRRRQRPRRRGQPRPGDGDRRRLRQPLLHRESPRSSPWSSQASAAAGTGCRTWRSRSARPPGWRSAPSTWSPSGRWPGRRRACASSGSASPRPRLPLRRSVKRLIGLGLSVVTFGIGFLGIVFGERRRGLARPLAGTDVIYDERRPEPAPWSGPRPRRHRPRRRMPGRSRSGPRPGLAQSAPTQAGAPSGPSASL